MKNTLKYSLSLVLATLLLSLQPMAQAADAAAPSKPKTSQRASAIRDRMQATGMMDLSGRRFVLTGGGSELTGLPEVARRLLGRNVRNGRPMGISGLPEMARGAGFATVAGMLIYPQVCAQEFTEPRQTARLTGTDGYFARVGNWLRSSF